MRGSVLQTPLKDQHSANRRVKSNLDPKRSVRKVLKKSLNPDFASVVEDIGTDLDSSEVISGDNAFDESAENTVLSPCPLETSGTETVAVSDLRSPSSTLTDEGLNSESEIPGTDSFDMIGSIEADMLLTSLKEARVRVLKSKGLGHSKNLLEALVRVMIEELSDGKDEGMGWLNKLLSSKGNLVFLAFMLCSLALAVLNLFLSFGSNGLPSGPPPT